MGARVIDAMPGAMALIYGAVAGGDAVPWNRIPGVRPAAGHRQLGNIRTGFRSDIPQLMAMMNVVVHASTQPEPFGHVMR